MKNQELIQVIDGTIKGIWEKEIKEDYECGWLLKEDTLKNSIYHHLRSKLGHLFDENDIRIFTEFTKDKFKGTNYRPDLVIAKVNMDYDGCWENSIEECLSIIEIKFKTGFSPSKDIYSDYQKLRTYAEKLNVDCNLYMATIWEYEDDETFWERKNAAWANGRLTELNASYKRGTMDMRFYVKKH